MRAFDSLSPMASATAPATFCVAERRPRSCPPPDSTGSMGVRPRTSSAPRPLGVPNLCPDTDRASTSQSRKRMVGSPGGTYGVTPRWARRARGRCGSVPPRVPRCRPRCWPACGDHRGTFTGLAVELAFKCVEIEMCLRIHGNAHDFETEPFVQPCRRLGHGRVLDSGNDNARATICRLFAIGFGESADRPQSAGLCHAPQRRSFDGQIVRFGAA